MSTGPTSTPPPLQDFLPRHRRSHGGGPMSRPSDQPGQRPLQDYWRSAQCWRTSISNEIGPGGEECLPGVLSHCTSLTHLYLHRNHIGNVGEGRFRASCRGQASDLVLYAPSTGSSLSSVVQTVNEEERHIVHIQRGNLRTSIFALN